MIDEIISTTLRSEREKENPSNSKSYSSDFVDEGTPSNCSMGLIEILALGIAGVYGALGDKEKAVEWLERAYKVHAGHLVYVAGQYVFENIRSDPRLENRNEESCEELAE